MLQLRGSRAVSRTAPSVQQRTRAAAGRPVVLCRAAQEEVSSSLASRVAAVALSALVSVAVAEMPALAVPQTSACATASCDGQDFSNRDLRKEFYTKGSLKGANFSNSNLREVTLFGANLEDANLENADLSLANLGQCNMEGANLTQANLTAAIVSSGRFDARTKIDGADFTDVIVRKDINDKLCKIAKGVNNKTGVDTRESLNCY